MPARRRELHDATAFLAGAAACRRRCRSRPRAATPDVDGRRPSSEVVGDGAGPRGPGDARLAAAVRERQRRAAHRSVDSPMTRGRPRQGHPCLQREEPAARTSSSVGSGRATARRVVGTRIKLGDSQKIVAIAEPATARSGQRQRRRDRDARGLPGGLTMTKSSSTRPSRQARRGHRDQDADPASRWRPASGPAPSARIIPRDIIELLHLRPRTARRSSAPSSHPAIAPTRSSSFFDRRTESGTLRSAGRATTASR